MARGDYTSGIPSTQATDAEVTSAIATHESDTSSVHGIADTSALATQADPFGWGFPIGISALSAVRFTNLASANAAGYMRVIGSGTITKLAIQVNDSAGDISVGTFTGAVGRSGPTTRTQVSATTACPASGYAEISITSQAISSPTGWFGISASSTSLSLLASMIANANTNVWLGLYASESSAHPLPASPSTSTSNAGYASVCMVGVA